MYFTGFLANTAYRADTCKRKRVVVFKSFNHTATLSPMWRSTLHHWKLVLLMLSRVKCNGVAGFAGGMGRGCNCIVLWFKVGWSRNNGHEKNMARLWDAAHFHYFERHIVQNSEWEINVDSIHILIYCISIVIEDKWIFIYKVST